MDDTRNGIILGLHFLSELNKLCDELTDGIKPIAYSLQCGWIADRVIEKLDKISILGETRPVDPIRDAYVELCEFQRENQTLKATNYGCEILFIPVHRACLLGIVYTEQPQFMEAVTDHPSISEYGYYDGDHPDDVGIYEWKTRATDWSVIGDRPARYCGFTRTIMENGAVPYPRKDDVLAALPCFEDRVAQVAKSLTTDDRMRGPLGYSNEKRTAFFQKQAWLCLDRHIVLD